MQVPSYDVLSEIYHTHKSISKTANHFQTSNPTVRKWLIHYNIPRYSHIEASLFNTRNKHIQKPDKDEFVQLFNENSLYNLQVIYRVGQETIYRWCNDFGLNTSLSIRTKQHKENKFEEKFGHIYETILNRYQKPGETIESLSEFYGCSETTIKKIFKVLGIEGKHDRISNGQKEIGDYISSLGFTHVTNNRDIISPLELDIVILDKKIAIEYCGEYWHSETYGQKPRNYHLQKLEMCEKSGYTLLTIFENEWKNKKEIVKSIIKHKLGQTGVKIYARDTIFKQIEYKDVKNFEQTNHIQGTRPANKYYGLFHGNELVMSISLGKSRFNKKYEYEIIRLCSKLNTIVVGGFSKLLYHIGEKNIITYADLRYGTGKVYEQAGFTLLNRSTPNYWYFDKKNSKELFSRLKFQKHKIPNCDMSKTEYENMLSLGYDRIWDCGNNVYINTPKRD